MSRSLKRPYTGSKRFSTQCRCHGGCAYCESSRLLYKPIGDQLLKLGLEEIEPMFSARGKLRVVRLNINGIQPLESIGKGSPKRVDIDLSKAFQKIKTCLRCGSPTR